MDLVGYWNEVGRIWANAVWWSEWHDFIFHLNIGGKGRKPLTCRQKIKYNELELL